MQVKLLITCSRFSLIVVTGPSISNPVAKVRRSALPRPAKSPGTISIIVQRTSRQIKLDTLRETAIEPPMDAPIICLLEIRSGKFPGYVNISFLIHLHVSAFVQGME